MVFTTRSTVAVGSEPVEAGRFQFVPMQISGDRNKQVTQHLVRSHAVKQALQNKRRIEQMLTDNFRVTTVKDKPKREGHDGMRDEILPPLHFSPSASALDPFQTLAVDSSRLQTFLGNYKARQASEPVFSIADELAFQSFRSVFRTSLADPALMNAAMLSFAFAVTGGSIDQECLGYQGQAIRYVRRKMSSLDDATSESTIGAILLLTGVEACLGMRSRVELHMIGVQQLLEICKTKSVYLSGGIKRAIFWQDLNSSILVGSTRIVDHTTFAELHWSRDPFSSGFYRLPPGFQKKSHVLTKDFLEVLEDINALRCIRDLRRFSVGDVIQLAHINNHTAWIQSRLVELPNSSAILECCHLAAYLCSVMLCCKVWCGLVVPSHISAQLLSKLQQSNEDPMWDDHSDLLLWLLFIGGAFAPPGFGSSYGSWTQVLGVLEQFIWSDKAFKSQVKAFWEENFV